MAKNITNQQKVHENRLRRMAKRQGLAVRKSAIRDPHALGYERFDIVDAETNATVFRGGERYPNLTLDEVERWLTGDPETRPVEADAKVDR